MIDKDLKTIIFDKQMHCLSVLKTEIKSIQKLIKNLENKIDSEGLEGYYSCNSDVLRHAQQIWKASNTLGNLKQFLIEIKDV